MNKAVFLDKDGTIIYDLPYNIDPALLKWKEDSFKSLKMLADEGYQLIVITNQSGVSRGLFTEDDLIALGGAMKKILGKNDIPLAGFYYCPHFKKGNLEQYKIDCNCRKPKPGMLINAARDLDIDLAESWMIGDMPKDVEAGYTAGCRTILIEGSEHDEALKVSPSFTATSLLEAAEHIINS